MANVPTPISIAGVAVWRDRPDVLVPAWSARDAQSCITFAGFTLVAQCLAIFSQWHYATVVLLLDNRRDAPRVCARFQTGVYGCMGHVTFCTHHSRSATLAVHVCSVYWDDMTLCR